MRQLWNMFLFDVRMTFRSFMGSYILAAPLMILVILRLFVPSVESTSVTIAVVDEGPNRVEEAVVAELAEFAEVMRYASVEEVTRKLQGTGSAEGLYWDPDTEQYVSLLERNVDSNAFFSAGARFLRGYAMRQADPEWTGVVDIRATVPDALADRTKNSPVATMGGAIFVVFMVIISAFLIGLGVVNDKEYGTDRAIRVSPVTKTEYYVGKSILPVLTLLAYTGIGVAILGIADANLAHVYVTVTSAVSVVLVLGLLMGALARNENEAMGIGKMLSMVMLLAVLGGALLPDSWQWVVYWVPLYWTFDVLEEVFAATSTWGSVAWKTAVMVGSTGVYFVLLRKRFATGLS